MAAPVERLMPFRRVQRALVRNRPGAAADKQIAAAFASEVPFASAVVLASPEWAFGQVQVQEAPPPLQPSFSSKLVVFSALEPPAALQLRVQVAAAYS